MPPTKPGPRSVRERIRIALRLDKAIKLVWGITPGLTVANGVLVVLQGLFPLVQLFLIKQIVDSVGAGIGSADKVAAFKGALLWIVLMGVFAILQSLVQSVASLVTEAQGLKVTDVVSDMIHKKSMEVDLGYYENALYFETMHRAQGAGASRPLQIVNGLIQMSRSLVSLAGILALLFAFNWWIGLVLFAAALPNTLVRLRFSQRLFDFQVEHTRKERQAWYYHFMLTGQPFAKEMRLFQLGAEIRRRFQELRKGIRKDRLALSFSRTKFEFLARMTSALAMFAAVGYIAWSTVGGAITVGALVMYYQGFQRGIGYLQSLLGGLVGLYENNLFLTQFNEFMALEPEINIPESPQPMPISIRKGVRLEGVTFTYPGGQKAVLQDLDFHLDTGEVVALVGSNGCGKTTLVKLLCRLYDPGTGRITVDGIDLRELDPREWRRRVGVTFQDYMQYHMTLEENIRMGNIESTEDIEAVMAAARKAGADPLAAKFKLGYATPLGKWFEEGEELSTGEWQKVALARTFFRDAEIVILDEPSAALDPEAEAELFNRFRRVIGDKTALIISHRYSTVRMADRICVLEGGRIIEEGSHVELLARKGRYHHLYCLQARNYQE